MLEKTFSHNQVEEKFRNQWKQSNASHADPTSEKEPYVIMMPPPNVTGNLHIGHAIDQSIPDALIRYHRMKGKDCLWLPGTDHASIAVHVVLERQMREEGKTRFDYGREEFLKRAWQWKEQCHSNITNQISRLGIVPDWSRERFTLDENLNRAVTKVFVDLYKKGKIYRAKRLVNWNPLQQSGLSDLEVVSVPTKGSLWHIRYPLTDGSDSIVIATTRPETMLGDTALAVHPEDARYKHLIGKTVRIPLVGRDIPIIADDYIDRETGSGAMKVTPAHDYNDFALGERHKLPMISIMDLTAHINENAPEKYRGMERFEARKAIVADLEEQGFLEKIEPWTSNIPYDEKTQKIVIEPMLSDQWWCDQPYLAQEAIKAVEDGRITFVPKSAENTYFAWLRNIQPWCISRQLWWGHQIPAWYGEDGEIFVAASEKEAQALADQHYGKKTTITRDSDVLDTWFSSALWPFSTLGWPDKTIDFERYYPTSTLSFGSDIIFFWVARMIMMGLEFIGEAPFKHVLMHGMVRDEKGQKMSKTKGNVIDPLLMVDEFGADALRFGLIALAPQGRDINIGPTQIEKFRNFLTKIWNAARYMEMNGCTHDKNFNPDTASEPLNRWIINETRKTNLLVQEAVESFRLNDMANTLYQFIWGTLCDWYLELTKPLLAQSSDATKAETQKTLAWVFSHTMIMLNPLAPFITEELWANFKFSDKLLFDEQWPEFGSPSSNDVAVTEIEWLVDVISTIRSLRAELRVNPGDKIPLMMKDISPTVKERLDRQRPLIEKLARLSSIDVLTGATPKSSVTALISDATIVLPLEGIVDLKAETARLEKELAKIKDEVQKIDAKLGNDQFVSRAPQEVIEEYKERRQNMLESEKKLDQAVKRLNAA